MTTVHEFFRRYRIFIFLIVAGLALKLCLVFQPFDFLITNLIPDDAFYYFSIARKILAGLGSTFDGIHTTNGYHPLWMLVILPLFKFFSLGGIGDIEPIRAALILSALLDVVTAVALLKIFSRFTERTAVKVIGLSLWLFNPFVIYEVLNGLETSLSLAFTAIFILCALRVHETRTTKNYIAAGAIGGLMMLARLDNLLIFVAFLVWLFVTHAEGKYKRILQTGIAATVIVLPWLVWNIVEFNMVLTASGRAFTLVHHELIVQDHGPSIAQKIKAVIYTTYNETGNMLMQTGAPALIVLVLGAMLGWLVFNPDSRERFSRKSPVIALFLGFVGIFILNASIRWTARSWYFIAINLFVAIAVVWFLNNVWDKIPKRAAVIAAAATLMAFFFFVGWTRELQDKMANQREMVAAAEWMNVNLPGTQRIGVFNAGIQNYFSRHIVQNLDGLANNEAYEAMRRRKLWQYVRDERLAYISDFDIYLQYRYRSFFGDDPYSYLLLVNRIALGAHSRSSDGIKIYKVTE